MNTGEAFDTVNLWHVNYSQVHPSWYLGGNVDAGFESVERLFREKLERGFEWAPKL